MRKLSGFTLFEMMIVIAVLAIVTALAVPSFQLMMAQNRVAAAANETVNIMAMARNAAITRRRTVIMQEVDGNWETRLDDKDTGLELGQQNLSAPLTVVFWQGDDEGDSVEEITFAPDGRVFRSDVSPAEPLELTIRFCDDLTEFERGRDITVSRIGRVLVEKHAEYTTCNPA